MYYEVCPCCGAHLDPGEKCDCRAVKEEQQERVREYENRFVLEKDGQLKIVA